MVNDKNLGILAHVLGLLTSWVGPLILFLMAETDEVKQHARNALNWQISYAIYIIAGFILVFVIIGIFVLAVVVILDIVFCIRAAIKASKGEVWQYPLTIPFVK